MAASPHCCWTRRLLIVAACFALITGVDPIFGPVSALADPGGGNSGERDTDATNLNRNTVKKKAPAALPPKKKLVIKKPSQAEVNAELARRLGGDTIEAIFILGRVIKAIPGEIESLKGQVAELEAMIAAGGSDAAKADLTDQLNEANAQIERFRQAVPVINVELQTLLNELPHVRDGVVPAFRSVGSILQEVERETSEIKEDLELLDWVDEEVAVEKAPEKATNE
jgi:hypothetical protein